MKVKPTTAYVGDSTNGKLTLYVPYYGVTGIGQIELSSSFTSSDVIIKSMQILPKEATDTEAEVSFKLEGDIAPNGPLPILIDGNYTLNQSNIQEIEGVLYDTGAGFSSRIGASTWLATEGNCHYDSATSTYTQKIKISYNTDENNSRAGAIVVFSPSGREVTRFVINQKALEVTEGTEDEPVVNGITIHKLVPSSANAANCYIIPSAGRYELPAYMGAYSSAALASAPKCVGKPHIEWNDNSGENVIEFFQGDLSDNKILFDINPVKDANGVVTGHKESLVSSTVGDGNALISIKDDGGRVLWSWHLWFCEDGIFNSLGVGGIGTQSYDTGKAVHSRNLGSDNNYGSNSGIYYQWGRKDPLKMDGYQVKSLGSEESAREKPTTFDSSWVAPEQDRWDSANKSKYDPCPPGYRVPKSDTWAESAPYGQHSILGTYQYDNSPNVYYPYSGFIDAEGVHKSGTVDNSETDLEFTLPFVEYYDTFDKNKEPKKFKAVIYDKKDITENGNLWTSDQYALVYGRGDYEVTMKSARYSSGYYRSWLSAVPTWNNDDNTMSMEDVKNLPRVSIDFGGFLGPYEFIQAELLGYLGIQSLFNQSFPYKKEKQNQKNGYQVRCVTEQSY